MKKCLILIAMCVLLMGSSVYAKELPYENCNLTNNRFENTISMERENILYLDDVSQKAIKPTKKELKQAKSLYKKISKMKKRDTLVLTNKEYKNITRLMGIINTEYFYYVDLDCTFSANTRGIEKYELKGYKVQKNIRLNKEVGAEYQRILKDIGLNKNTTEHDAELLINNYIKDMIEYDFNSDEELEEYGGGNISLYTKKGICDDYSMLFYYLANGCGLKCGKVIDYDMKHAYNIVYVGGKPTYVDVCWNDTVGNEYIFLTEEEILKSHGIDKIIW